MYICYGIFFMLRRAKEWERKGMGSHRLKDVSWRILFLFKNSDSLSLSHLLWHTLSGAGTWWQSHRVSLPGCPQTLLHPSSPSLLLLLSLGWRRSLLPLPLAGNVHDSLEEGHLLSSSQPHQHRQLSTNHGKAETVHHFGRYVNSLFALRAWLSCRLADLQHWR